MKLEIPERLVPGMAAIAAIVVVAYILYRVYATLVVDVSNAFLP